MTQQTQRSTIVLFLTKRTRKNLVRNININIIRVFYALRYDMTFVVVNEDAVCILFDRKGRIYLREVLL